VNLPRWAQRAAPLTFLGRVWCLIVAIGVALTSEINGFLSDDSLCMILANGTLERSVGKSLELEFDDFYAFRSGWFEGGLFGGALGFDG